MFVRSTLHSPWTCSPALVIRVDMQSCACHSCGHAVLRLSFVWTCSPALVIRVDMQSCACHSCGHAVLRLSFVWTCSPALVIRVDMQSCACHSCGHAVLRLSFDKKRNSVFSHCSACVCCSHAPPPPPPSSSYPFLPLSSPSTLHPLLGPTLPNIVFSELPTTLICASLLVYLMRSLLVRLCQHANHEWLYAQIRMLVLFSFFVLFFVSLSVFSFFSRFISHVNRDSCPFMRTSHKVMAARAVA